MTPPTVAVLLTAHNRREQTLACLATLFGQGPAPARLVVHLVDDGSTDGTGDAVRAAHPEVRIVEGGGSLYWSGGMAVAEAQALKDDPDHVLWLNDDVRLRADAVATLLRTHADLTRLGRERVIVVGAMRDAERAGTSYSGLTRSGGVRPNRFFPVDPGPEPVRCDTMNGNLVLVPRAVRRVVGALDPTYTHALNDLDYGLRASARGCEVWLAPGHLGECARNGRGEFWHEGEPPFLEQLRRFCSPTVLPPRDWLHFNRRHAGWVWPLATVTPYARVAWRAARRRPDPDVSS